MLLATALLWGGAGLVIKAAPLAGPQLAFWRCLLGAVVYQSILLARGHRPSWEWLRAGVVGGLGFGLMLVLQFVAYKSTTLVSASVIIAVQPLLLGVVGYALHGDRHGGTAFAATLLAVAGTVGAVLGSTSSGSWSLHGDVAALGATVVGCLYPVGIKQARHTQGALELQASILWIASLAVLPAAAATGAGLAPPPASAWLWVAGVVAVGGTGHLLYTAAQRHVSVLMASTVTLAEIVVVAVGAVLAFGQAITAGEIVGMAAVALAVGWWLARAPQALPAP